MDTFKALSQKTKLMIIASSLFLLTLSIGMLVFGQSQLTEENSALQQFHNTVQADMLYVHPSEGVGH